MRPPGIDETRIRRRWCDLRVPPAHESIVVGKLSEAREGPSKLRPTTSFSQPRDFAFGWYATNDNGREFGI